LLAAYKIEIGAIVIISRGRLKSNTLNASVIEQRPKIKNLTREYSNI
jgi:hypothetical protein